MIKQNEILEVFEWVPNTRISDRAMRKLLVYAPERPPEPPKEAWAWSTLPSWPTCPYPPSDMPISAVPYAVLNEFLFNITSGLHCFAGSEETWHWVTWYEHLLPYLINRGHESWAFDFLIEPTITTFFRIDASGLAAENLDVYRTALYMLGKVIMKPELWDDNGESVCSQKQAWCFWDQFHSVRQVHAPYCSGAISSSLFFCLVYLPTDQIRSWTKSVLSIQSVFFRAHLLAWLAGAYEPLCVAA
jgi:hypothetical protein